MAVIDEQNEGLQSREHRRYATWLHWGTNIGLVLLAATFAAYTSGALPSRVPPAQAAQWWGLPVADYLAASGAGTGWAGAASWWRGDALAMLGIAWRAGCSVPCLLALLPLASRQGERRFAWICLAEAAVILLAASGLITRGH